MMLYRKQLSGLVIMDRWGGFGWLWKKREIGEVYYSVERTEDGGCLRDGEERESGKRRDDRRGGKEEYVIDGEVGEAGGKAQGGGGRINDEGRKDLDKRRNRKTNRADPKRA